MERDFLQEHVVTGQGETASHCQRRGLDQVFGRNGPLWGWWGWWGPGSEVAQRSCGFKVSSNHLWFCSRYLPGTQCWALLWVGLSGCTQTIPYRVDFSLILDFILGSGHNLLHHNILLVRDGQKQLEAQLDDSVLKLQICLASGTGILCQPFTSTAELTNRFYSHGVAVVGRESDECRQRAEWIMTIGRALRFLFLCVIFWKVP